MPRRKSDSPRRSDRAAVLRTLLVTDLVDSTRLCERLGDEKSALLGERHDRLARELMEHHGGREIDKTDGFLILFERPIDAVHYALEYHEALVELGAAMGVTLEARAGIHLGEVVLRENPPDDVARGAKPLEVEGIAKPVAARIMSLALPRQTLLTRTASELAQRATTGSDVHDAASRWLAHGACRVKGLDVTLDVFEVGREGQSPLRRPPSSEKAHWVDDPVEHHARGRLVMRFAAIAAIALSVYLIVAGRPFQNAPPTPPSTTPNVSARSTPSVSSGPPAQFHIALPPRVTGPNEARLDDRESTPSELPEFARLVGQPWRLAAGLTRAVDWAASDVGTASLRTVGTALIVSSVPPGQQTLAQAGTAFLLRDGGESIRQGGALVSESAVAVAGELHSLARSGQAEAQFKLGLILESQQGGRESEFEAAEWYRRAAEGGHAGAMNALGMMYANKENEDFDPEARRWFLRGAEGGDSAAMYNLGLMMAAGRGGDKDDAVALEWLKKSARAGHKDAMTTLARMGESW